MLSISILPTRRTHVLIPRHLPLRAPPPAPRSLPTPFPAAARARLPPPPQPGCPNTRRSRAPASSPWVTPGPARVPFLPQWSPRRRAGQAAPAMVGASPSGWGAGPGCAMASGRPRRTGMGGEAESRDAAGSAGGGGVDRAAATAAQGGTAKAGAAGTATASGRDGPERRPPPPHPDSGK